MVITEKNQGTRSFCKTAARIAVGAAFAGIAVLSAPYICSEAKDAIDSGSWRTRPASSAEGGNQALEKDKGTAKKNICEEKIAQLLADFLGFSGEAFVNKGEIEGILYDISLTGSKGCTQTKGRAVHIGDSCFLTAYHVVDGKTGSPALTPQQARGRQTDSCQGFEVAEYDQESDLALLRASGGESKGKARLHLGSRIPSLDDRVSAFIRLTGSPSGKRYEFEYGGKDFYDKSTEVASFGKLILPAQSLLFEKQGRVLEYDTEFLSKVGGSHKCNPENEAFTSVLSYNGESGQPMFLKAGEDQYIFAGILTGAYGIKHEIQTPEHPLGYRSMQQTGAFFAHRAPIERLVRRYITKISSGHSGHNPLDG